MKDDMTLHLLYVMKKVLEGFPKNDYVRVESWTESGERTLTVMMEVRTATVHYR